MLVLSRKKTEQLILGNTIIVSVLDIRGLNVRLAISAPIDVTVHRQEVYEEVQEDCRSILTFLDPNLEESSITGWSSHPTLMRLPQGGGGLVLSRYCEQSIIIGTDVRLTIVDIRGDKARIGIEAPDALTVHRREVYEAIQREIRTKQKAS